MKTLLALLLLVPLLSYEAVGHRPPGPMTQRFLDCDDPESEAAAAVALNYINAHHPHGYKYALNSIEKITVLPRRPFGEIFLLELDLLETECHIVNPLPVENCTVRPLTDHDSTISKTQVVNKENCDLHQLNSSSLDTEVIEGDCDVKLLKMDGKFSVVSSKCHSTPDSAEDVTEVCPYCPLLALLNDTRVINTAAHALTKYNNEHDGAYLKLLEIGRAQIQHLPASVSVEFAVFASNCSTEDAHDHADDCQALPDDLAQFGFCKATVIDQNNTTVSCTIYEHQPGVTHHHLIVDHLGGQLPTLAQGFKHHDLGHFHHGRVHATSESSSAEVHAGPPPASPAVKRDVGAVLDPAIPLPPVGPSPPNQPLCPGRIRHFQV